MRLLSERSKGKAVTIVTTPPKGPTSLAVEFAEHAETAGADGILAVYPDRYYTDDSVYAFFREIAGSCAIGVLIHLLSITAGRAGMGPKVHYSLELVERIAAIDNMVGMKEESHDQGLVYKYNRLLRDSFLIIGGAGGMRACLTGASLGPAGLSRGALGVCFRTLNWNFTPPSWRATKKRPGTSSSRRRSLSLMKAVKVGWHLALKEAMAVVGIMEPWERAPMRRLSGDDRERIVKALRTSRLV